MIGDSQRGVKASLDGFLDHAHASSSIAWSGLEVNKILLATGGQEWDKMQIAETGQFEICRVAS